ncbi:MAG: HAD family hydrolase [Candidatus Aenigmatarchaeota archaeon]
MVRTVVFDYDGTIVKRSYTYEFFKKFNKSKICGGIINLAIKKYMEWEISLPLEQLAYPLLLYCLKGVAVDEIENYIEKTTTFYLIPGIKNIIKETKKRGIKVGIVSENIQFQPRKAAELLDLDFVVSNEVEVKDGIITGKIYRFSRKNIMIEKVCEQFSLNYGEIFYVGDDVILSRKIKCLLFNPKRRNDKKKVDNNRCFLIKDLYQFLSLIETK